MIVVPDSDIILIKSPLKLDNYNQITFSNASVQESYFKSLPHLEYDDCAYLRKDGVIRYATGENLRFENLLQYNYCMYKNDSYQNKWFYAFITDVKYINDGMSEVTIETDTFQTWQFYLIYKNSFMDDVLNPNIIYEEGIKHIYNPPLFDFSSVDNFLNSLPYNVDSKDIRVRFYNTFLSRIIGIINKRTNLLS